MKIRFVVAGIINDGSSEQEVKANVLSVLAEHTTSHMMVIKTEEIK